MDLTEEQNKAIQEIDHNLQIIACAGSGKTEVIVRRIAHILEEKEEVGPGNIVAFTFTNKGAESMRTRIKKAVRGNQQFELDKIYIGTIHSFCFSLLDKYSDKFNGFKILDTVKSHHFVKRYSNKCGMSDLGLNPNPFGIKLFLDCIQKMVDDYDNYNIWDPKHREVFEKYRKCLYDHEYMDFSLLIFETIQQIRNNPAIKEFLMTVKYLVVDEYQDVDDLQELLIHYFSDFGANVCVVGDDDQTIYQFRGSNANNMLEFKNNYPDVVAIKLEKNFRCGAEIVDIADNIISNNKARIDKNMISHALISGACEVRAQRFVTSEEQYDAIAKEIIKLSQFGLDYSEIAVLVRKGKYINPIIDALESQGIPYATNSADYFFKGIYFRRFIETLRILVNVNKAKLYECWKGYMDESNFSAGFKYLRRVASGGGNGILFPLSSILDEFLKIIGFLNSDTIDYKTRLDDFLGIKTIIDDYDEIYSDQQLSARINGLLYFLDTQASDEYKYHSFKTKEDKENAVQIMTVHKSKGLEFNSVFLVELENGEFPTSDIGGKKYWHVLGGTFKENKDKYQSDLEDERKLFYVAVTRAKQNLYLYYQLSKKKISTFVREAAKSEFLEIDKFDIIEYDYKRLRRAVMDYYGTAMHSGFKMAVVELGIASKASNKEILAMAEKIRLDLNKYIIDDVET